MRDNGNTFIWRKRKKKQAMRINVTHRHMDKRTDDQRKRITISLWLKIIEHLSCDKGEKKPTKIKDKYIIFSKKQIGNPSFNNYINICVIYEHTVIL